MANLTVQVDDETLARARVRAAAHGTSVQRIVRDYLERFAGGDASSSMARVARLSEIWARSNDPEGRPWTRDELHERG